MSKPHRCPHIATTGNVCVYCPGGPDSDFEYSTQSYTGYEPTSMRAIRARYNPYQQARGRIDQLSRLGHDTDKVEYIVMGGTFMSLAMDYRDYFIRNLHDALSGHTSSDIHEAVRYSEQSRVKCIGLTIETRPDYCKPVHLRQMLEYGCTRLEIGVQSVYEDVARDTNRGHSVKAITECFHMSKDAGFKVVAHMMPDLPNVGYERDMNAFKEFFENPSFRSDGLKIYPTLVIRGTGLYELWKTGKYKNYHPDELVGLLAKILTLVPPWVRIYRIQRDIPMPLVTSGVEYGNLRELVLAKMEELGTKCRDVRTREVGIQDIHHQVKPEQVELIRRDYTANGGWETFLSYEDPQQDILIGLLRLRKCSDETCLPELGGKGGPGPTKFGKTAKRHSHADGEHEHEDSASESVKIHAKRTAKATSSTSSAHHHDCDHNHDHSEHEAHVEDENLDENGDPISPLLYQCSIVRELHVYGSVVPVHSRDPTKFQHQGFGTLLMEEAERIAREEHGSIKLAVIAGVGTRHYYRKLGFELDGPYMVKMLI